MRFRFTVRRMMAAVILAAIALVGVRWFAAARNRWAEDARYRASSYQIMAQFHDTQGKVARACAGGPDGPADEARIAMIERALGYAPAPLRPSVDRRRALDAAEWHERRAKLYKRAATRPWLQVEKDAGPPPYLLPETPAPALGAVERGEDRPEAGDPSDESGDGRGDRVEWPVLRRERSPGRTRREIL